MKANPQSAATIRSIIRWATGIATAAIIMTVACALFPLLSSFSAFSMTLCLSLYAGLQIALPPVDEADDWVPVRASKEKDESRTESRTNVTVLNSTSYIRPAA